MNRILGQVLIALGKTTVLALLIIGQGVKAADNAPQPLASATPQSQGFDSDRLEQAIRGIEDGQYGAIDSLLILRHDYLVLEHYSSPLYYGKDFLQSVRSVTKSVSSALIGIALEQGKLPELQTRLPELFPQYTDLREFDARKQSIRFEQLLSMTAGFEWDEWSLTDNNANKMARSQDWVRYVLDQPISHEPGETWTYNSGVSLLLSDILTRSTGQAVDEYARRYLLDPIGIQGAKWSLTPNNIINTGSGLAMTRRDMARFGLLYLREGRWQGEQIVPADWVSESTRAQILGKGDYFPYAYGYHWWRLQDADPTIRSLGVNDLFFALGFGGHFILVVPHLDLVVVSTASNYGADEALFFELLRDHVFPALPGH